MGLRDATEAEMREAFPAGTGLLVVREIVPGGPADGILEPGDVLLRLGGARVADFVGVESVLDESVGQKVMFEIQRGGVTKTLELTVQDLHEITPHAYLEMGGAVLHPLSYQLARGHGVPLGGLFLANPGYAFSRAGVPGRVVLTEVDGKELTDLESLESALAALPDGARFQAGFYPLGSLRIPSVGVVQVDRKWFPMRRCNRDDQVGRYVCRASPPAPSAASAPPAETDLDINGSFAARRVARSLVSVSFDVPYAVDGVQGRSFQGSGLIVDADRGLVVVDRDTVPVTLGDAKLTFGGSVEVPAKVVGFHPAHNLAVVQYDPERIAGTPVRSATLRDVPLETGDEVQLVAMTNRQSVLSLRTQISRVDPPTIPLPRAPRFRESNAVLIALADTIPSVGGALTDRFGRVVALWDLSRPKGRADPVPSLRGFRSTTSKA